MSAPHLYGLLAEFSSADGLLRAVKRLRTETPYRALEAYSPFPIEGLDEALGPSGDRVAPWMLIGAILGGIGTFALECYAAVLDYPINVGGRPLLSWQAFLPPAIEMSVLAAALCGAGAMLVGNALPRLNHPLFGVNAFERASADRFFLVLRADDAAFELESARARLGLLEPLTISEVPV